MNRLPVATTRIFPFCCAAATEPHAIKGLHATILRLLGLKHIRLTYSHNGRPQRLTDLSGDWIRKAIV